MQLHISNMQEKSLDKHVYQQDKPFIHCFIISNSWDQQFFHIVLVYSTSQSSVSEPQDPVFMGQLLTLRASHILLELTSNWILGWQSIQIMKSYASPKFWLMVFNIYLVRMLWLPPPNKQCGEEVENCGCESLWLRIEWVRSSAAQLGELIIFLLSETHRE